MNVELKTIELSEPSGAVMRRQVLVAAKDFKAGEEIYVVSRIFSLNFHF